MKRCRGQSMAEFAAGVAVLGMLVLGTVSVAGLQEIQRREILAAREAAFQGEWLRSRGGGNVLREQLARHHFDDAGLTNATGTARMLQPGDVSDTSSQGSAPGRAAAAFNFLLAPLRTAGGLMRGGFDLDDSGFRTGIISAMVSGADQMPAPFRELDLRFDQPYALLGDDWSASGPAHVARRAGGLVPSHLLSPLAAIWRPLSAPLALFEPSLAELCLGLIEPDRVPEDRLGPGPQQRPASCR
ncbi:MAG: hypothetical protein U1F39_11660 [Steroidobacteraceae bacterium]